jgi:hypothetical protein
LRFIVPSTVAGKQLAINEIVAEHFIVGEKPERWTASPVAVTSILGGPRQEYRPERIAA